MRRREVRDFGAPNTHEDVPFPLTRINVRSTRRAAPSRSTAAHASAPASERRIPVIAMRRNNGPSPVASMAARNFRAFSIVSVFGRGRAATFGPSAPSTGL